MNTERKPLDWVLDRYLFPAHPVTGTPWEFKPKQIEVINDLALNWNAGFWLEMSVGKTACATACALYHNISMDHATIVVMPPLLIPQWAKFLRSIKDVQTGKALTVCEYRGTPRERAALDKDVQFLLVGYQIFKKDYALLREYYNHRAYTVILDEATAVSNVKTDNHRMLFEFTVGHPRMLLSGTPANNPLDAYGLLRFTNPTAYRSQTQFINLHVADVDFYGKPVKFKDLERVYQALEMNSQRVLFREVHAASDPPMIMPVEYELDEDHYKLYKKLANEQLLELETGGKIDATTANKLTHALGQIVVNHAHFSGDPSKKSAAFDLIEELLHELGHGKLVVCANYRMSIAALIKHFEGAVAINSEVSQKDKEEAVERFTKDPSCRLIVIHPKSGGYGLDGLQYVCNNALWIEPCTIPRDFAQANARLDRTGQTQRVIIRIGIAKGTTQPRAFNNLLANDALMNSVIRTAGDLRSAIFGG